MEYKYLISKPDFVPYRSLSKNLDFEAKLLQFVREAQDNDLKQALGYPVFYDLQKNYLEESMGVTYATLTIGVFAVGEIVTADNGAKAKVLTDVNPLLTMNAATGDWAGAKSMTGGTSGAKANISAIKFGPYYRYVNGDIYIDIEGYEIRYGGVKPAIVYWAFAHYIAQGQDESTATGFAQKNNPYSTRVSTKEIATKISNARSTALNYYNDSEKFLRDMSIKDASQFPIYMQTLARKVKPSGGMRLNSINRFARESRIGGTRGECPDEGYGK